MVNHLNNCFPRPKPTKVIEKRLTMADMIPHSIKKTLTGKIVIKYCCPHCNDKLESDISEAGITDKCPGCGKNFVVPGTAKKRELEESQRQRAAAAAEQNALIDRELQQRKQMELQKAQRDVELARTQSRLLQEKMEQTTGRLVLNSGAELIFNAVLMFSSDSIQNVESVKALAINKLTPVSTGIGFYGSLGHVVGASVALGLVEGIVNSARSQKGEEAMVDYLRRYIMLHNRGVFRPVLTIRNIQLAEPSLWYSVCEKDGTTYRLIDQPFICIRLANGSPQSIRWSLVEQFWVDLK